MSERTAVALTVDADREIVGSLREQGGSQERTARLIWDRQGDDGCLSVQEGTVGSQECFLGKGKDLCGKEAGG